MDRETRREWIRCAYFYLTQLAADEKRAWGCWKMPRIDYKKMPDGGRLKRFHHGLRTIVSCEKTLMFEARHVGFEPQSEDSFHSVASTHIELTLTDVMRQYNRTCWMRVFITPKDKLFKETLDVFHMIADRLKIVEQDRREISPAEVISFLHAP